MRKLSLAIAVFVFIAALADSARAVEQKAAEQAPKFLPTTVEADRNYDGKIDRKEYYEAGAVVRTETDTDFDGSFDETVYFRSGKPARAEKDTNKDGKPDTWVNY